MVELLLCEPLLIAVVVILLRSRSVTRVGLLGTAVIYLVATYYLWQYRDVCSFSTIIAQYFHFDALGIFFFSVMSIVFAASSLYSLYYFREHQLSPLSEARYTTITLTFLSAMTAVLLSTHLALLWVFVEATTLTSALLIYFEKRKSSLEAAWKYVFICSVGIALAFVGIIILSIGSRAVDSLFFADLTARAAEINPFWLKIAFAFLFVGFGTKIGVAPIHAWLPDAHSEAPSPVSALLSGTLLNTAFVALLRIQKIFIAAHLHELSNFFFLVTGFFSLMVSATFMLRVRNYKRMLAYSSIENMGILFIGTALGPNGIMVSLLQAVAHSFSKASLFLVSGNILAVYKSKKIDDVRGLLETKPLIGWLWILSMIALIGFPPFPVFLAKFMLVRTMWFKGFPLLAVFFFLLLLVVAYGMSTNVLKMTFGERYNGYGIQSHLPVTGYIPQIGLLLLLTILGVYLPQQLHAMFSEIVLYFQ